MKETVADRRGVTGGNLNVPCQQEEHYLTLYMCVYE